tara:strand:+ start:249 stop:617 length:369 start_codon:yes stop_codon:yes gene_type:complete
VYFNKVGIFLRNYGENKMNYANQALWSDVEPNEIIKRVSDITLEIRAMDAVSSPDWKPEIISGGFAGHCVNNNDQKDAWIITSNENYGTIRIRKNKRGVWKDKSGNRYFLSDKPVYKYDFNF